MSRAYSRIARVVVTKFRPTVGEREVAEGDLTFGLTRILSEEAVVVVVVVVAEEAGTSFSGAEEEEGADFSEEGVSVAAADFDLAPSSSLEASSLLLLRRKDEVKR